MTVSLSNCGDVTAQLGSIKNSRVWITSFARKQDNNNVSLISIIIIKNAKRITNILELQTNTSICHLMGDNMSVGDETREQQAKIDYFYPFMLGFKL